MSKGEYRRPLIRKVINHVEEEEEEQREESNSSEEEKPRGIKTKNIRGNDDGQKVNKIKDTQNSTSTTSKTLVESSDKIVLREISTSNPTNPIPSTVTLSPLNEHPYNRETTE